tara:strand:- start:272 stop:499 length:228 start_codon:yes stop_codon:yes gene_type:complete
MAEFNNKISLWKRKPKETDVAGKAYPHYSGNLVCDGVTKDIAIWIQTEKTKPGSPDLSGTISEPYKKPSSEEQPF